jgi:PqqD family protein of HPr-rel-A system
VATAWRSLEPGNVLWAEWDGEYVLYHRPSGKTHFVNAATVQLLKTVLLEPKSARAAALELAAGEAADADDEFCAEVAALLERLEHVGLVERRDG